MDPEALHILSPLSKEGEKSKSFIEKKSKLWLWVIIAWIILVTVIVYFTFRTKQALG